MSNVATPTLGVGECSHPVALRRTVEDLRTGNKTATEHAKRCGARIEARCPSCSALYRGDAFQVIRTGLFNPATKLPKLFTMVTLTAPGSDRFGETHVRHISEKGHVQRCSCKKYHNENDLLLGTPVDPETYNYAGATAFNANASRLFAVTMQKLSRILGRKLQVVRVVEFQKRGLVHVHALVLGTVTQRSLEIVVRGGKNLRTGRTIAAAQSGGWMWGPQCQADVKSSANPGEAIFYLVKVVKYALKDTGKGECKNYRHGRRMHDAAETGLRCGKSIYECEHGSRWSAVDVKDTDETTGEITYTRSKVYLQGKKVSYTCRKHRRAIEGWGFRGHVLAKSRNWGCTFRGVRERRQSWANANKPSLPTYLLVTWKRLPEVPLSLLALGNSPP